jgi:drug/metabolite transporter (DMT)-like permease
MKIFLTPRVLLALLVAVVFWASAFAGIRAGLQSYPPAHLAIVRFLVASAVLVVHAAPGYGSTRFPLYFRW